MMGAIGGLVNNRVAEGLRKRGPTVDRQSRGSLAMRRPALLFAVNGDRSQGRGRLVFAVRVPLEWRPTEYQLFSDNRAMDFQLVTFAADIGHHFEEPKPVANVYRDLSGLLKSLEKFVVGSKFDKRAVGHVSLLLPALLL
jgi:hypothetical protein